MIKTGSIAQLIDIFLACTKTVCLLPAPQKLAWLCTLVIHTLGKWRPRGSESKVILINITSSRPPRSPDTLSQKNAIIFTEQKNKFFTKILMFITEIKYPGAYKCSG